MKKIILFFFVLVLLTACNNNRAGISLQEIIDTFEENDIKLEKVKKFDSETFGVKLNGVKPNAYSFNNEHFFIYIFKTIEDREEGWKDFYDSTSSKNTLNYDRLERVNVLILHVYNTESNIDMNQIFDS